MCSHVCSTIHITPHETHIAIDGVTTDDYSQSKCRVVEPIPNGYVYKTFPHLRCRNIAKEGAERLYESQEREFAVALCPLGVSGATSMQSHLHVCSNVSLTRWHQWTYQTGQRKLM